MNGKAAQLTPATSKDRVVGFGLQSGVIEIKCSFSEVVVGARVIVSVDDGPVPLVERLRELCRQREANDHNSWTFAPWSLERGGARYVGATDGRGLVAVRNDEETAPPIHEGARTQTVEDGMARLPPAVPIDLAALKEWLVAAKPERVPCNRCRADRKVTCNAPGCRQGKVRGCSCGSCSVHTADCETCKGVGEVDCTNCDAKRQMSADGMVIVGLAGRAISRDLAVRYLAPLEGPARICATERYTGGSEASYEVVIVEAANGFALLMPMRAPLPSQIFPLADSPAPAEPAPTPASSEAGAGDVVAGGAL